MSSFHLTSLYKEHTRSQGYHRIYVSFPMSKLNAKDTLLNPSSFASWIPDSIKADIYFTNYKEFPSPTYDEIEDAFQDIELLVLLVDKSILDGSPINDLEVQVADENSIPVLPILIDTRHIALFNETFSHRQCLVYRSKDGKDSFHEKLEKFLIKYLEGGMSYSIDEIDDIFTPPVFLSYRKKDKCHLKEFLSSLHEEESLVPYSFWYDDFLNPGNNYDDEIKEVLDKSEIFVLFITKNIFEPNNYVLDIEYPYALKNNKTIIGVTFGNFDKKLINKHFPEIKQIYKHSDINKISNALLNVLPSHNIYGAKNEFLLAQAYYYGFNVERNKEIAFTLFNKALYNGEIRSAKYLAYSYYNNDMSESDVLEAARLQKKYVEYISGKGAETKKIIDERRILVRYLIDSFNLNDALTISEENIRMCQEDSISFIHSYLDRVEILTHEVPVFDTVLDYLNTYKDKIIDYSSLDEDEAILSLRIRYLFALYYFNVQEYKKAYAYISEFSDTCFKNDIYINFENLYLSSQALFLLANILEKLEDKKESIEVYMNAFVMSSFEKGLSLNKISSISLYKVSLVDSEFQETLNSYLSTSSYLAIEDRTRFDELYAYFLSQSDDFIHNVEALYLYERYTQLNLDSFVDEKIELYSKLFNFISNNNVDFSELENKEMSIFEYRAFSYLLSDSNFPFNLLERELFLRDLKGIVDEETEYKKLLLESLSEGQDGYEIDVNDLIDYRDTQNDLFFIFREEEETEYPLDEFLDYSFEDDEFLN